MPFSFVAPTLFLLDRGYAQVVPLWGGGGGQIWVAFRSKWLKLRSLAYGCRNLYAFSLGLKVCKEGKGEAGGVSIM